MNLLISFGAYFKLQYFFFFWEKYSMENVQVFCTEFTKLKKKTKKNQKKKKKKKKTC